MGFVIGLVLRLMCGEKAFNLDPVISFGYLYGEANAVTGVVPEGPLPYRTFVMLISLACHVAISTLTDYLFTEEKLNLKYDFFSCFRVSSTTGLIGQSSNRHLTEKQVRSLWTNWQAMEVISQDLSIQEMENETYTNPDLLLFFRTQIFYKFLYEQKKSILTFRLFRLRA